MNDDKIEYPQIMNEIIESLSFLPEHDRFVVVGMFKTLLMLGLF